jgi:hypothetical protein
MSTNHLSLIELVQQPIDDLANQEIVITPLLIEHSVRLAGNVEQDQDVLEAIVKKVPDENNSLVL